MNRKKPTQRTSRSIRFKRYEVLYNECMEKAKEYEGKLARKKVSKKSVKTHIKSRKRKSSIKKSRAKHLNSYQEFVREESRKPAYKHMTATERMKAIGKAWKNKK